MKKIYRKGFFIGKHDSLLTARSQSRSTSGFTLLEVLVVIVMIGILSTVAAPSWIAFIEQRKVNTINENSIMRAIQQAQTEAKKSKRSYSVSFRTQNSLPQFVVHLTKDSDEDSAKDNDLNWEPLSKGFEIKPEQILLCTNLGTKANTLTNSMGCNLNTKRTIKFDYKGNLESDGTVNIDEKKSLIVSVGLPQPGNSSQQLASTTRCVKVMTLLGTLRTGKGAEECKPSLI